jgi:hypothetical protein
MSDIVSPALHKRLSKPFRYADDDAAKILSLCVPTGEWLGQYPTDVIDEMGTPDALVIRLLENRADRFLNFEDSRPASKVEQRQYLEALDYHLGVVQQLLTGVKSIDATTADPFKFLERAAAAKGKSVKAWEHRSRLLDVLLPIQIFARWRLQNDLKPTEAEREEESAKRRRTFPRFCFIADLLAAYQRATGKAGGASVHNGKPSEAVEFIMTAANPVLSSCRQALMDVETAKKEIIAVKAFWRKGIRPEQTYVQPDWGKHNWAYEVGTNP